MRLLVLNQYYPPDLASTGQLAADICRALARRGFEVHVVTAQPSYTSSAPSAPSYEFQDGVSVYRVDLGASRGRERFGKRVTGYLRYLWGAWLKARRLTAAENFDKVLTFHNPPLVPLIGAYLARRRGLGFVYALYDLHPDIVIRSGWRLPRWLTWIWNRMNQRVFQAADTIIVLGEGMKRTLVEGKGVPPGKVRVIPTWGRPELSPIPKDQVEPIRKELDIGPQEVMLLYAGNMGLMHPLDPILDAAVKLRGLPIRFLFVGDGVRRGQLLRRIRDEKLGQVSYLPFQPEERFVRLVAAADACLVTLEPGFERLAVPSRAYTFLSAGRPLITMMAPEADLARLVTETGCGWNAPAGRELAHLLRRLIHTPEEFLHRGRKAREIYEERFKREVIIEEYAKVLCQ